MVCGAAGLPLTGVAWLRAVLCAAAGCGGWLCRLQAAWTVYHTHATAAATHRPTLARLLPPSLLPCSPAFAVLPGYEQQVCALEALQMYAPMGHALGLTGVAAQLEDHCFQVRGGKLAPLL